MLRSLPDERLGLRQIDPPRNGGVVAEGRRRARASGDGLACGVRPLRHVSDGPPFRDGEES